VCYRLVDHHQSDITLIDLLPQETALVIESKSIVTAYNQLQQGLLGKVLSRADFPSILHRFPLTEKQQEQILAKCNAFLELKTKENVLTNLPPDSLIALIPQRTSEQITFEQIGNRLVFIGRLPPKDTPEDFFARGFGPILREDHGEFQGVILTRLHFEKGASLSYFTHAGVLAWAFEESVLHPCIYQLLQDLIPIRAGVTKHSGYLQLKKLAARKTQIFIYMRLHKLRSLFPCLREMSSPAAFPCAHEIALYGNQAKKGMRYSLVALADQTDIAAFKRQHHLDDAVTNAPIGRLSENTSFALWTNWFKPQKFWSHLRQINFAPIQVFLKWWAKDLQKVGGVTVPEFLALIGNDVSLDIEQMESRGEYPRSLVSISLAIKDAQQVGRVLDQLTQTLHRENVLAQGVKIVQFLMADGLLKPAYGLGKHRLFLADSAELIKRMYNKISQAGQHGRPSPGFYGQRSNFFLFLRTGDMVEWVFPVVETIRHDFGQHYGNSFDDWFIFHPLVQSILMDLTDIETTRIRGFIGDKELFFELGYTLKKQ